jgi:hypothetical protein
MVRVLIKFTLQQISMIEKCTGCVLNENEGERLLGLEMGNGIGFSGLNGSGFPDLLNFTV